MGISARTLKQLGHPSGFTGRLILWMLNRVNVDMNGVALKALDLRGGENVLEIGFGGGALLSRILTSSSTVHVTGADISALAINTAAKRFRNEHRVNVTRCAADTLPLKDAMFNKVVCVNVIYFWPDVEKMLTEVYRVLKDGGHFVICYSEDSPDGVTRFDHADIEKQLRMLGFTTAVSSRTLDKDGDHYQCTVAGKSAVIPAG